MCFPLGRGRHYSPIMPRGKAMPGDVPGSL
jgi:hypothetical protein